jgi:plastocyanin
MRYRHVRGVSDAHLVHAPFLPLGRRQHATVKEDASLMNKQHAFAALPLAVLVAGGVALAGCGSASSPASKPSGGASASPMATTSGSASPSASGTTITVTSAGFTPHTLTIHAGQPVVFADRAGTHLFCVSNGSGGTGGTTAGGTTACATASQAPNAPVQLVGPGTVLSAGQQASFTFKTGTYHIIVPAQPGMSLDITVK